MEKSMDILLFIIVATKKWSDLWPTITKMETFTTYIWTDDFASNRAYLSNQVTNQSYIVSNRQYVLKNFFSIKCMSSYITKILSIRYSRVAEDFNMLIYEKEAFKAMYTRKYQDSKLGRYMPKYNSEEINNYRKNLNCYIWD